MRTLWQDLRFGARTLLKKPGFTLIAVLTLALGIGANTAIFTVINAVLLRPLPFKEPERLVFAGSTDTRRPQAKGFTSLPDFVDWRAGGQSFERMAAWFIRDFNLTGGDEALRVRSVFVSDDLFNWLGTPPKLGRVFAAGEGRDESRVALLSYGLWQRRFNSDPHCVGQSFRLNDESYTVIGVMPPGFRFPLQGESGDLWGTFDDGKPAAAGPLAFRNGRILEVIGRLKPNVAPAGAQAEIERIAGVLRAEHPDTNEHTGARVVPAVEGLAGDVRLSLMMLFGAVGCVLLIACANVANLLLARAGTRQREMAVRAAMGASRWRIVRQLLTESLLLAVAGGLLGGLLAWWGVDALLALSPGDLPRIDEIRLDGSVLGFTLLVSLATGLIFGLTPAWQASRVDLAASLKDASRATGGAARSRVRNVLVVAEIAVAMVLLTAAGLLMNSFWRLRQVNPGFDPRNVLAFRLALPDSYDKPEQWESFYRQLQTRLQQTPGVRSASVALPLPLHGDLVLKGIPPAKFEIEGRPTPKSEQPVSAGYSVQPDYFRTMGIRFVKGRNFTERDDAKAQPVVIINQTLARRYFSGEDPIGKRINPGGGWRVEAPMREIIAIVNDVKHAALDIDTQPELYLPFAQDPFPYQWMVVKTGADPNAAVGAVRAAVQSLNHDLPLFDVKPMAERFDISIARQRFSMALLAVFAGLALVLTVVGLYGVVSCSVTQRTHEIGVRMALGAQTGDVLKLVVKQGMALALIGVAAGLVSALALTRLMKSLLYGVSATDPLTFLAISLLLTFVALFACWLPARRAARVDPMIALRYE